jgi:hypothetical protein
VPSGFFSLILGSLTTPLDDSIDLILNLSVILKLCVVETTLV